MRKKILCGIVSVIMILTCVVPVFATTLLTNTYSGDYLQRIDTQQIGEKEVVIKRLHDFENNEFILIETGNVGYYIFDAESKQIMEWSFTSASPYLNCTDFLYYAGPMNYYRLKAEQYVHILSKTNSISRYEAERIQTTFTSVRERIKETAMKSKEIQPQEAYTVFSPNDNDFISYSSYITNAQYPANVEGTCGYVAACIVLNYWNKRGLIDLDDAFLTASGNLITTPTSTQPMTLQDKLISYTGTTSTTAPVIRDALNAFCDEYNINATATSYIGRADVTVELAANRPVMLFGYLPEDPEPAAASSALRGKVLHAVTVYGLNQGHFICHYGWSGYECVIVNSGVFGGNTHFVCN